MNIKHLLKFISAGIMPVLYLAFVATEHYGFWDRVRGLDDVRVVAQRMNISYAYAKRQYRPTDPQWQPTLDLIKKYTKAELPRDRTPVLIGRWKAVTSAMIETGPGITAEWTAPTTPIYLGYVDQPTKPSDIVQVGDINDLFLWIDKSKSDFRFLIQNVLLGIFSLTLGIMIWGIEHREKLSSPRIEVKNCKASARLS